MRNSRFVRLACVAASVLGAGASALGHDFWIRMSQFTAEPDASLDVMLEIGHAGDVERFARNPARIERFVIAGPGAKGPERDIPGVAGADPAGVTVALGEGAYVIGYRSTHARSELPAEKFESYLREEGLEEIAALRAASDENGRAGREVYSRCAKALVRAGSGDTTGVNDGGAERVLGFTLELVPVGDPTLAKPGETVRVRLLHRDEPYVGALVTIEDEHAHDDGSNHMHEHVRARTDSNGEVEFVVDRAGVWLVTSVVMEAAPEGLDAEWESWWASLTFEVR